MSDVGPQFPSYPPPPQTNPRDLMKAVRTGMKKMVKNRAMKKLLARPPGCKLKITDDVKITPRKQDGRSNKSGSVTYY